MQASSKIHNELLRSAELLDELETLDSLNHIEDTWLSFLGHLERVWYKCQHHFGKSPRWNGWKGRYDKQRSSDPLLSYLTNARGSDEHTVAEITEKTPSSVGMKAGPCGSVHIKSLRVSSGSIQGEWAGDLEIIVNPASIEPAAVVNRGKLYAVPTVHLGNPLSDSSFVTLGKAGLAYYQKLVADAEKFFCK